jgi:hypothetical protein
MADYFTGYANPVPAGAQTSMADMLNLASGVQNYQQAQQMNPLALQKAQAEANVAQQTQAAKIAQAQSQAGTAATQLNSEQLDNLQKHVSNATRSTLKLLNSDDPITPQIVKDHITQAMKNAGAPEAAINQALQNVPANASDKDLRVQLGRYALNSLSAESQIDKLYPANQMVPTGARAVPTTAGGALAMQAPGQATGPGIQAELPPTTPVVRNGVAGYLGAPSTVQAALTPQQSAFGTGTGTAVASDVAQTQADAVTAPKNKAIFQTIKGLIPDSYTGLLSEKKLFAEKVADAIGIPYDTLKTSNTEELIKNQNLLTLVGGNTDAARALAQVANPNVVMTKAGLNKVVNQLIGFEDFKLSKANFLSQYINDPTAYGQKLMQFTNAADPRFFQQMTAEEAQQMLKSMTPAELTELRQKKAMAKKLGIIQ